ncbi:hypothetical protein BC938DRAFT_472198, partial [Jimgerdemannia flammicorona]
KRARSTVAISKLDDRKLTDLLDYFSLVRTSVKISILPISTRVEPFEWTGRNEDQHKDQYEQFLRKRINFPTQNTYSWYNPGPMKEYYNVENGLPFPLKGTMDMSIVDKNYIATYNTRGGTIAGFEMKKIIEASHIPQAIGELLMANLFSNYAAIAIIEYTLGATFKTVQDIREADDTTYNGSWTFKGPNLPISIRRNLKKAFVPGDAAHENAEWDGLENLLHRRKVDVLDLLPEDDVAPMRDVFDTMTEEEIRDYKSKKITKFLTSPAFKSEGWCNMYS